MHPYNERQIKQAASRRRKIRELRAKGWKWARIAKKYAISIQRAHQLGALKKP